MERQALTYPLGRSLFQRFSHMKTPLEWIHSHNRLIFAEDCSPASAFVEAKEILVLGVKRDLRFKSCAPSADYRLVLGTSCPGKCQYCYLTSTLGKRVYVRVYVNQEEILSGVDNLLEKTEKDSISFEASSSSDPVPTEHLSGHLAKAIAFFGERKRGRLRIVTKFHYIDPLLTIPHGGKTHFRFSINAPSIINAFEENTSSLDQRLQAAQKILEAGYSLGFLIAPLFIFPGWEKEYQQMLFLVQKAIPASTPITFELIMHRFTKRGLRLIEQRHPSTNLEILKGPRVHKGFGKYVYPPEQARALEQELHSMIGNIFPRAQIQYFT